MPELLIVSNPSPRRVQRRAKPRASKKQIAWRKKFAAKWGRSSPGANMAKRKVRRKKGKRSYRKNPIFRAGGNFTALAKQSFREGGIGAVGAIGMDLVWGFGSGYLPDTMKAGYVKYAAKGLAAVLLGIAAKRFAPRHASALATGGMTVVLHDALKDMLMSADIGLPLSEYLTYSPGSGPIVGTYGDQGLGALPDLSGGMNSLGFNSFETDTLGEYLTEAGTVY